MAPWVNSFLIGGDPEFVVLNGSFGVAIKEVFKAKGISMEHPITFGWDHGGAIAEIRPEPSRSVFSFLKHVKKALFESPISPHLLAYKWRAGAYCVSNALGGHVHFGVPPTALIIKALDTWASLLEERDILPREECNLRRCLAPPYGSLSYIERKNDPITGEINRFEYRTFPSWLYSPAIAYLTITGAKLAVVDPNATIAALKTDTPFETLMRQFPDRDARRVVEKILPYEKNLKANPDIDFKELWQKFTIKGDTNAPVSEL